MATMRLRAVSTGNEINSRPRHIKEDLETIAPAPFDAGRTDLQTPPVINRVPV